MDSPLGSRLSMMLCGRPSLGFNAEVDDAAIADWTRDLRMTVRRLLDYTPHNAPDALVTEERRVGGLAYQSLSFAAPESGRFNATLVYPAAAKPARAILVLPGRNARHAQVIGLEPLDFPDRNIAERLALANFAALAIDFGLKGALPEDKRAGRDETGLLAQAMALKGRSLAGLLAADAVAALRWLTDEPWLDPAQIGIVGHSLGGFIALYAALAYDRPVPLALASCAGLYRNIFACDLTGGGAHALPGILNHADLPDLMGAVAPSFLHIQHGETDPFFPLADAQIAVASTAASYARQQVLDRFEVAWLRMGHGTDCLQIIDFFMRAFAAPAVPRPAAIPPARIEFSAPARRQILDRVDRALSTGALTLGPCGAAFERIAATWTGTPDAVAVNSGTSAIEVALRVVGVSGRRVLLPANTFFATASASLSAGAELGFIDIELDGLGMNPDGVRRELECGNEIAAVVTVHIGGIISPRLGELASLCARHGVALIEDAAHALGSFLDNAPAGSFGRMAAFSLYPTKIITSGEGGIVAAHHTSDAAVARSLRDHGKRGFHANIHDRIGSNWRMSEVHAAIGMVHIENLAAFIEERRLLAQYYDTLLPSLRGITPFREPAGSRSNYYKYIALLDHRIDRQRLKQALRERHDVVLSGEVYELLCCTQPALQGRFDAADFPQAAAFAARHICLPLFEGMTRTQQNQVVAALHCELDIQLDEQLANFRE